MPQRPSSLEHWLVILAVTWGLTLSTSAVAEGNPPETLSVYTWEQYMDPAVVEEIAARQAEYVYYATPNIAARELLPESFLSHPVIYPSQEILDRSEFLTPIPARAKKRINAIGSRLVFK